MIEFTNPMTSADLLERGGYVYIQKSQLGVEVNDKRFINKQAGFIS